MALLTAIAGIVTPLGLGESLAAGSAQPGTFEYMRDDSAYGQGTSLRGQNAPSRICIGENQGRQAPLGGRCKPEQFSSRFVLFLLSQKQKLSFGSRDNRKYPKKEIMS
jgi:hypothetical protein